MVLIVLVNVRVKKAKYERLIVDMRNEIEREREKSSAERHSLASQLEQATRESKDLSALLRERDEVMLLLWLGKVS